MVLSQLLTANSLLLMLSMYIAEHVVHLNNSTHPVLSSPYFFLFNSKKLHLKKASLTYLL